MPIELGFCVRPARNFLVSIGAAPDDVWEDAARHYDEQALAGLVLSISLINVWNRLNVRDPPVAGQES
jgi:hypothetical protein